MSSQQGRGGRDSGAVARGAGFAAAKGAGLIGLAVIVGIVLLQIVDDGTTGPVGNGTDDSSPSATTTTAPDDGDDGETTTSQPGPKKSPEEIRVLVLNGGAPSGSARTTATGLKQKGYTNQPADPNDWVGRNQEGNLVLCREGFEREASTLAIAVGEGTPTEGFPDPAPPFSEKADCVVVVGATA